MTQETELEFAANDALAGFRLQRLEIFNWGTFHQRVWELLPQGENCLVTGDIGSGKSTLVDAITTLLLPAQHIAYNKAAGAAGKERTLRSYVQGYYKTERSETGHAAKPVALRDHHSYSVLLAVFQNQGYDQQVSLAQVFWNKDLQGQPSRFYLAANQNLTIASHFANFGNDIIQLRKRLRNLPQAQVFETYPPYAAEFRRRFGINHEQALGLFHQTVSLKSVGNLTDFVREHMLETTKVEPRIAALIGHFDDLNRAHEAVLKAKQRIERLAPLAANCEKHQHLEQQRGHWRWCREGLKVYFSALKADLLRARWKNLQAEENRLAQQLRQKEQTRQEQLGVRDNLKQAIAQNGGDRIERITAEINEKKQQKIRRQEMAARYQQLVEIAELPKAQTCEAFSENRNALEGMLSGLSQREAELQNQHTEHIVELTGLKQQHQQLSSEISSLKARRSNIDSKQIQIRKKMCEELNLKPTDMPFAGELIQVKEEASAWEGAAERLLRNFGLSLLVPDKLYFAVAQWVDHTRLQGRLVYYRIKPEHGYEMNNLHADSLANKLAIKPDSEFYAWLEHELGRRFDYACCQTLEQFHHEQQALTPNGQVKVNRQRYEKDDRHALADRSRYVLGWTNKAKIAALAASAAQLQNSMQTITAGLSLIQSEKKAVAQSKTALEKLAEFRDYGDLDWQEPARTIANLEKEKQALEAASDVLKTLGEQLTVLENSILENEAGLDALKRDHARNEEKQGQAQTLLDTCQELTQGITETDKAALFRQLTPLKEQALGKHLLTVESCDNRERVMRDWLQQKIDNEDRRMKDLEQKIIQAMQDYRRDYPLDTQEIDAALQAAPEYLNILTRLQADDLPRFEQRFKELLNENTIREVANFQSQLHQERQTIKERIDRINQSLGDIEYNPGRYIVLEAQTGQDAEIRNFQQQLRACTEGALTGSDDEQYAEGKFLQVKDIIERFRGREGTSEMDKRWMLKVTDVRNWFMFAASERWQEDHSEHEHYTDSGGKSGGQKEKLAYTVLAASLAYQFGLEWGAVRSRSFRFVVIDEAFGRGSDESTRYALELFKKLHLQLLIVTPLQKIRVIEPYVASVGFVHNEDGWESRLRNLTIEEYQAELKVRAK